MSRPPDVWSYVVEVESSRRLWMRGYNWRYIATLNGRQDPSVSERYWHGWTRTEERAQAKAEKRFQQAEARRNAPRILGRFEGSNT